MNRLEEIKERHKQDEIEYSKVSKGLVHEDRGYLLQRLERYEKALQQISTFAIVGTVVHGEAMKEIAEEALKE